MAAIAHSKEFAKKAGVPMSVGRDFIDADKGKKFKTGGAAAGIAKQKTHHGVNQLPNAMLNKYIGKKKGGIMKHSDIKEDMPMMKKVAKQEVKAHEKSMHKMAGGGVTRADGCVAKGHTKGKMITMANGGAC